MKINTVLQSAMYTSVAIVLVCVVMLVLQAVSFLLRDYWEGNKPDYPTQNVIQRLGFLVACVLNMVIVVYLSTPILRFGLKQAKNVSVSDSREKEVAIKNGTNI